MLGNRVYNVGQNNTVIGAMIHPTNVIQKSFEMLEQIIVTSEQMRHIEDRLFASGMPVAALMEKAAFLVAAKIKQLYRYPIKVGVLVGPGHNGGDALVVARELHLEGYQVSLYIPFSQLKDLTATHARYAQHLGIPTSSDINELKNSQLIVDGLFGFGLTRNVSGEIAEAIALVNQWSLPIVSIDIPTGLHTDTGEVLGTAIRATHTFCLGLWKSGFFQDQALEYIGEATRIDFGIPWLDAEAIISQSPLRQKITTPIARGFLPLPRPLVTHKYKQGHLLLVCGSDRYAGGAILTGLGARATGVGMLSIAVPQSLKPLLVSHLPCALIIGCPETETGAIASLPLDLSKYQTIACGPGLTADAAEVVKTVLEVEIPLVLDADALNIVAQDISSLAQRKASTVITPHLGEFKRLFPEIKQPEKDRLKAAQEAAWQSGAIVLLKGSRTVIASPDGSMWVVGESTPALARGGSGDVLTGLIGGLVVQQALSKGKTADLVATAAWWHSQAGILAAVERTEMGVDAFTLTGYLLKALSELS